MYDNLEYHKELYRKQRKSASSYPRSAQKVDPGSIKPLELSTKADLDKLTEFYLIETSGETDGIDTELKRMDFSGDGHGRWIRPNWSLRGGLEVIEHTPNGYGHKYIPLIKGDGPGSSINVYYKASMYQQIYPQMPSNASITREISRFRDQVSELFLIVDNEYNR